VLIFKTATYKHRVITNYNSVALVRKRTIPTDDLEMLSFVSGEISMELKEGIKS
jgi:hypothetical protein